MQNWDPLQPKTVAACAMLLAHEEMSGIADQKVKELFKQYEPLNLDKLCKVACIEKNTLIKAVNTLKKYKHVPNSYLNES